MHIISNLGIGSAFRLTYVLLLMKSMGRFAYQELLQHAILLRIE